MKELVSILLLFVLNAHAFGQSTILLVGNTSHICLEQSAYTITRSNELPDSLELYDAILIFSSAESVLTGDAIDRIQLFMSTGKGLYLGSENWPLQAESNQVTTAFFGKQVWGNFTEKLAISAEEGILSSADSIPAGNTTVAFPLDYRLKVEAWVDDEPLVMSGKINGGRIILDGGYSRFYCSEKNDGNELIFLQFLEFLTQP